MSKRKIFYYVLFALTFAIFISSIICAIIGLVKKVQSLVYVTMILTTLGTCANVLNMFVVDPDRKLKKRLAKSEPDKNAADDADDTAI